MKHGTNQLKDRVGEVSYTKYGTKATIVQYINYKKVLVKFHDNYGYEYFTSYENFKKGSLTNPYECRNKMELVLSVLENTILKNIASHITNGLQY